MNVINKFQISLVQMQLYNNPDSFGVTHFKLNQLNPILMPDMNDKQSHSLWGLNIKVSPLQQLNFYNQWVADNLFSNKNRHIALQAGANYTMNFGTNKFFVQTEYNQVAPMTFTSTNKIYNWKHFREPLAHPYGQNFSETIFICSWDYKRWQLSGQANIAKQLKKITDDKPYKQVTIPYFSNGNKLNWYKAEITFYLNTKTLMNFSLGYVYRKEKLEGGNNSMKYVYFSFNTKLFNKYYDF